MVTEFELTLDNNGMPCVEFKYQGRSNSLEQKVLKVFIDAAKEDGLVLRNSNGYLNSSGENWQKYQIRIGKN